MENTERNFGIRAADQDHNSRALDSGLVLVRFGLPVHTVSRYFRQCLPPMILPTSFAVYRYAVRSFTSFGFAHESVHTMPIYSAIAHHMTRICRTTLKPLVIAPSHIMGYSLARPSPVSWISRFRLPPPIPPPPIPSSLSCMGRVREAMACSAASACRFQVCR